MRMAALARILDTGWEREDGVGNYAEGDDGSMWTPGKALWGSTQWGFGALLNPQLFHLFPSGGVPLKLPLSFF